jgi:uncharacterized membrane protein
MSKRRLGAFSDGVIAIIITIMVLEMKVPEGRQGRRNPSQLGFSRQNHPHVCAIVPRAPLVIAERRTD